MDLELLKEEDGGRMSLKGVIEMETSVEKAHGTVVASDHHLPSPAGAALDSSTDLLGNRSLSRQFLLEELELPPLIHRWASLFLGGLLDRNEQPEIGDRISHGRGSTSSDRKS